MKKLAGKRALAVSLISSFGLIYGLSVSSLAAANSCLSRFDTLFEEHETTRQHLNREQRDQLTALRQAAGIAVQRDHEDACEEVTEIAEEWLTATRDELVDRGVVLTLTDEQQRERLAAARPVDEGRDLLRFRQLVGLPVKNLEGEDLGEAEDVLIEGTGDTRAYIVVGSGGILGLGEDLVAVPITYIAVTQDENALVLKMATDELQGAPKFAAFESAAEEQKWISENDAYFASQIKE